jgi:hypothetical protein
LDGAEELKGDELTLRLEIRVCFSLITYHDKMSLEKREETKKQNSIYGIPSKEIFNLFRMTIQQKFLKVHKSTSSLETSIVEMMYSCSNNPT